MQLFSVTFSSTHFYKREKLFTSPYKDPIYLLAEVQGIQYGWYLRETRLVCSLAGSAYLILNWWGWYIGKGGKECVLLNWLGLIFRWPFSLLTNWYSLSVIAGLQAVRALNHGNWSAVGYMGDCAGRRTAPGHLSRFVGMVEFSAAFSLSSLFDLARRFRNQYWK